MSTTKQQSLTFCLRYHKVAEHECHLLVCELADEEDSVCGGGDVVVSSPIVLHQEVHQLCGGVVVRLREVGGLKGYKVET